MTIGVHQLHGLRHEICEKNVSTTATHPVGIEARPVPGRGDERHRQRRPQVIGHHHRLEHRTERQRHRDPPQQLPQRLVTPPAARPRRPPAARHDQRASARHHDGQDPGRPGRHLAAGACADTGISTGWGGRWPGSWAGWSPRGWSPSSWPRPRRPAAARPGRPPGRRSRPAASARRRRRGAGTRAARAAARPPPPRPATRTGWSSSRPAPGRRTAAARSPRHLPGGPTVW